MTRLFRLSLLSPSLGAVLVTAGLYLSLGLSRSPAAQLLWDPSQNGSGTAGSGNWNTTAGNTVWYDGTSDVLWSGTGTGTPANGATFNGPDAAPGTYVVTLDSVEPGVNSLLINANGYTFTGPNPIFLGASDVLSVAANKTVTFNCNMAGSGTSPWWVLGSGATLNLGGNLTSGQQLRLAGAAGSAFNLSGANAPAIMFVLSTVNVTAGSVTPSASFYIGYDQTLSGTTYTSGTLSVSGASTVVTINGNILIIGRATGSGTLVLNDGTVNVGQGATARNLAICYDGNSSSGTVKVYGGTLNVGTSSQLGSQIDFVQTAAGAGGKGVLLQTNGTINAWGGIIFGAASGSFSGASGALTNTGGFLYVGQNGITRGAAFSAANNNTLAITLSGGTVGALGNWSSALPITLDTVNGNITFQCADGFGGPWNISLSGPLTGAGGLNVSGGGTLTLSGANNYAGSTVVSNGTLVVTTTAAPTNGPVLVDGSAGSPTLAVQANAGQYWSLGSLGFANGSPGLSFQFGALAPSTTVAPMLVGGDVAFATTPAVTVGGTAIAVGTYPLLKYTGTLSGTLPGSVTTWTGGTASAGYLTNIMATKTIALVVTSSSYNPALYWRVGNGTWDISTTPNWTQFGGAVDYTDGNAVLFDDSASGSSPITVTLNTAVNPLSVTANNNAKSYTITGTGSITGSGALQVLGNGSFTLATTNSYSGGTVVSGGQLNINNGGDAVNGSAIGTGPLTLNAGATLDNTSGADVTLRTNIPQYWNGNFTYLGSAYSFNTGPGLVTLNASLAISNAANTFTVGGNLTDNGQSYQLSKIGNGTLTLAAPNHFGSLTLYAGQLNLADPGAACSGVFTIYGGAVDNTSGGDLTLNSAPSSYVWAGNFSFLGSGNLDLGYSLVSIPNGLGNITLNIVSNTLTTHGDIVNNNTRVIKTGNGTWEIAGSAVAQSLGLLVSAGQVNLNKFGGQAIQGGNNLGLTIQAGALVLDENSFQIHSSSPVPVPVVLAGGTWDLNGFDENVDQLSLSSGATLRNGAPAGTSNIKITSGYTAQLNGDDCRFDVTAADGVLNFNGPVGGSGSLVKIGAGVLNLNGTNTYTGNTTVSNGTLVLSYPTLASTSAVSIVTNGLLQLNFAGTNTVSALVLNGASQPVGVYNTTTTPAYLAGTGYLEVTPSIPSTPTNLAFSLSGDQFLLSWPSNYVGWILQTNVVGLRVSNAWYDVPGSGTNTQLSFPLTSPAPASEFFRLRYP